MASSGSGNPLKPCCLAGFVSTGNPVGEFMKIGPLNCYVSRPPAGTAGPQNAIILNPDAFGIQGKNSQLVADTLAREGFLVVAVDYFYGKPAPEHVMDSFLTLTRPDLVTPEGEKPTLYNKLVTWPLRKTRAFGIALTTMVPLMRRAGTPPPVNRAALEPVKEVIRVLKKGDILGPVGKVGTCGFCWGGGYALGLAGSLSDKPAKGSITPAEEEEVLVDTFIAAHTTVKVPDFLTGLKRPGFLMCAENDFTFPDKDIPKADTLLKEMAGRGLGPFKVKQYKGTYHGFVIRGDDRNEVIKAAKEEAVKDMVDWFKTHLAS